MLLLLTLVSALLGRHAALGFEMQTEAMLKGSPTLRRLTAVVNALSGRIDQFEQVQVEQRLIHLQERFDEGGAERVWCA